MRADHLESLRLSIEETLTAKSSEADTLACYRRCVALAEETIGQIREELTNAPSPGQPAAEAIDRAREEFTDAPFPDQPAEIAFYKEDAPWIWGYYLYYSRLVEIEVWRKVRSPERFRKLLQQELRRAELYAEKHSVCEYYYIGLTDSDERLFLRRKARAFGRGKMGMFLDRDIPTGTYELAWMRAYELLRAWLNEELEAIEYRLLGLESRPKFVCNLEIMEALELLKGLHVVGMFKDWSFKRVICWAEQSLGIKIAHYDSLLQDLKRRKLNRTEFLDQIKKDLLDYIEGKG